MSANEDIEKRVALVDDFMDREGKVLSYDIFMEQHEGIRINPLTYLGWCRAIPRTWKRLARGTECLTDRAKLPTLVIKGKEVMISSIKPSFYNSLLIKQSKPTAQLRWEADGVDFGDDWKKVYNRAFKATKSTKLQSLQFKIKPPNLSQL